MKAILKLTAWSALAGVVLFGVLNPERGLAFQGPMSVLGVGLIGLGLCLSARQKLVAAEQPQRK